MIKVEIYWQNIILNLFVIFARNSNVSNKIKFLYLKLYLLYSISENDDDIDTGISLDTIYVQ